MARVFWFKAKLYGYGWYPATWHGWVIMLVWALLFASAFRRWDVETQLPQLFLDTAGSLIVLIVICVLTGEPARWRWGGK